MESQRIAGLSLAVVGRGAILKEAGYGIADIERNAFMRPDTVLRIGSISKQFIASAIMLLVEGNQLSLDDPITTYLHNPPAAWRRISVRQLLAHTSGLVREPPGYDPRQMVRDARIIASGYDVPLQSRPGDRWSYSNLGYWILAEIISVASGMHWANFVHDRIFRPVGMRDTLPTTTVARGRVVARGYRWQHGEWKALRNAVALRPSGAFISTVLDLAKWDAALYGDQILSRGSRAQMWTPVTLNDGHTFNYGFGWQLRASDGRLVVYHGGTQPGFQSSLVRNVYAGLTVIVLTNGHRAKLRQLCQAVSALYIEGGRGTEIDEPVEIDEQPGL
jgi:CubicO group peptidase (beta-lactamase class C family)